MAALPRLTILAAVTVISAFTSDDARAAQCTTPSEYAAAIENGTDCAVSSCLYLVITQTDAAPTHPYPEGFAKAWLSGYRTLAAILDARRKIGFQCALTADALAMAGFPPPFSGAPYQLHVVDGCALANEGHVIAIPTVAEWVRELEDAYGIEVSLPVFRALVADGMDFGSATGCRGQAAAGGRATDARACVGRPAFPDRDACSCSPAFDDAYRALRGLSPYGAGQTTSECFAKFETLPQSVAALRAALWACQDADPYNTFNGLGFDGSALTLPEFIVDNISFDEMGAGNAVTVALPDPATCSGR
jgi:hypothetical protein